MRCRISSHWRFGSTSLRGAVAVVSVHGRDEAISFIATARQAALREKMSHF